VIRNWPESLFNGSHLGGRAHLRVADGRAIPVDVAPWHDAPSPVDRDALARVVGPVLDIGCGPGRHVLALVQRDHEAVGIDVSPAAVRTARRRGAPAVRVSVWGAVPRAGHWGTALLLDGNIGIGGDPVALLRRTGELLGSPGRVIVELASVPERGGTHLVRVEHRGVAGPWFAWATVTADDIGPVAAASGFALVETWSAPVAAGAPDRVFCLLAREVAPAGAAPSAQDGGHVPHRARRPA
jgi:SAM-dependent methyltransferase